jgi:hypothetical protein
VIPLIRHGCGERDVSDLCRTAALSPTSSAIVGLHDRKKVPVAPHLVVGALPRENCSLKETHYWMASNSRPLGEALRSPVPLRWKVLAPHTVVHNRSRQRERNWSSRSPERRALIIGQFRLLCASGGEVPLLNAAFSCSACHSTEPIAQLGCAGC